MTGDKFSSKKKKTKEFKINEYLSLRLENGETNVYVAGEKFIQCKYLLLNKRGAGASGEKEAVESIEEIVEGLDKSLEMRDSANRDSQLLSAEEEFWAHCSNLQAWAENGYDTRMLHVNLSFPLLRKLTKAGDPLAKEVFKEEITKRFKNGDLKVRTFLVMEGYLDHFDWNEHDALYDGLDYEERKQLLENIQEAKKEVREGFLIQEEK